MTSIWRGISQRLATGKVPEVDRWFFMEDPTKVVGVVLLYLLLVLKILPAYMRNRKPYEMKGVLIVYNFAQVMLSLILVRKVSTIGTPWHVVFKPDCRVLENRFEENYEMYDAYWWYIIAKVTEMFDTVFFALRKRERQITFLHVYHHFSVLLVAWSSFKYDAAEDNYIIMSTNSVIHVIMYFYYMVAAMGPQFQKFIWWKKYMTMMQCIQFVIILSSLGYMSFRGCSYRALTLVQFLNIGSFLYLFLDFYRKSYKESVQSKKSA